MTYKTADEQLFAAGEAAQRIRNSGSRVVSISISPLLYDLSNKPVDKVRWHTTSIMVYSYVENFTDADASVEENLKRKEAETERQAAEYLKAYPSARLIREDGTIYVLDQASDNTFFTIYFGQGVCERVQVGTKKVEEYAPDAPKIIVEKPVYEYRCVDPINAMMEGSK